MAVTRQGIETILIKRCGTLLRAAGMDGTTVCTTGAGPTYTDSGLNADLSEPVAYAVRQLGGTTASYATATSIEIQGTPERQVDRLLDVTEKRTLETILYKLHDVNVFVGPKSSDMARLSQQVQMAIDRKL
jgi:hypothetical protein